MDTAKRIEWLERQRFYLSMKDHWTQQDFAQDHEWFKELMTLKGSNKNESK